MGKTIKSGRNRPGKPSARFNFVFRFIVFSALFVFYTLCNPFGFQTNTDRHSQKIFKQITAPLYASPAQEQITVALVSDETIAGWGHGWPIRYADHARVLRRIFAFEPRAVFIDFHFQKERRIDGTLQSLTRTLKRRPKTRDGTPIPVYFAAGRSGQIIPELARLGTPVLTGWDGHGNQYPLATATPQTPDLPTAAYALYRDTTPNLPAASFQEPLDIQWGSRPADSTKAFVDMRTCRRFSDNYWARRWESLKLFGLNLLHGLAPERVSSTRQPCPYSQSLEVQHLDVPALSKDPQFMSMFKDRYVLYGGNLSVLHDRAETPVNGTVPGVFVHAMALDNLLTYQNDYFHMSDARSLAVTFGIWFLVCGAYLLRLYRAENNKQRDARTLPAPLPASFAGYILKAGREIVPIAAMLLLCLLLHMELHWPVVDWIGLTGMIGLMRLLIAAHTLDRIRIIIYRRFFPQPEPQEA